LAAGRSSRERVLAEAQPLFRERGYAATSLEFVAALLRSPGALRRYSNDFERRLEQLATDDDEQPRPGVTPVEVWAVGHALYLGLQIYQFIAPEIITPAVFERAYELLAGLYPEP
jgi:AcrR family transcriptional regulator